MGNVKAGWSIRADFGKQPQWKGKQIMYKLMSKIASGVEGWRKDIIVYFHASKSPMLCREKDSPLINNLRNELTWRVIGGKTAFLLFQKAPGLWMFPRRRVKTCPCASHIWVVEYHSREANT